MPDLFHLPDNAVNQQWFYYTGEFRMWSKPSGVTMLHILAIGGGAGGGGGFSAGAATQAGGGSAGVTASVVTALVPMSFVPDTLYVLVGAGGAGRRRAAPARAGHTVLLLRSPLVLCWAWHTRPAAWGEIRGRPAPVGALSVAPPPPPRSTVPCLISGSGAAHLRGTAAQATRPATHLVLPSRCPSSPVRVVRARPAALTA